MEPNEASEAYQQSPLFAPSVFVFEGRTQSHSQSWAAAWFMCNIPFSSNCNATNSTPSLYTSPAKQQPDPNPTWVLVAVAAAAVLNTSKPKPHLLLHMFLSLLSELGRARDTVRDGRLFAPIRFNLSHNIPLSPKTILLTMKNGVVNKKTIVVQNSVWLG